LEARIAELPDFFVGAATPEEAIADAAAALEAFLASYRDRGELPPLPAGVVAERYTVALEIPAAEAA